MNRKNYPMTHPFPPEAPPEFPFSPPETVGPTTIPTPIVYEESAGPVEYRVLTLDSQDAKELEAKLNDEGRDGWWLVQIIPREKQMLLVLMRPQPD
jgi:hypothetical protein